MSLYVVWDMGGVNVYLVLNTAFRSIVSHLLTAEVFTMYSDYPPSPSIKFIPNPITQMHCNLRLYL